MAKQYTWRPRHPASINLSLRRPTGGNSFGGLRRSADIGVEEWSLYTLKHLIIYTLKINSLSDVCIRLMPYDPPASHVYKDSRGRLPTSSELYKA